MAVVNTCCIQMLIILIHTVLKLSPLCTAFQTDLNRLVAVPGLQEGVRHRPKRVQTSEDQEGPERAEAAVISLLPILTGREAKGQRRTSQLQHMRSR